MSKTIISTTQAPAAIGVYAQGVMIGDFLYTSGQLGIDPASGQLEEGVTKQTERAMRNVGAILEAAKLTYADIVKTTIFIQRMSDFAAVNEVYQSFFDAAYPARSCVEVAALPKGGLVEIECVAAK